MVQLGVFKIHKKFRKDYRHFKLIRRIWYYSNGIWGLWDGSMAKCMLRMCIPLNFSSSSKVNICNEINA